MCVCVFPHLELRRGCDRVEAINQLCHSLNITNESLHRPDRLNNLTCGVVNLREENPLHTNIGTRLDHLPRNKTRTPLFQCQFSSTAIQGMFVLQQLLIDGTNVGGRKMKRRREVFCGLTWSIVSIDLYFG